MKNIAEKKPILVAIIVSLFCVSANPGLNHLELLDILAKVEFDDVVTTDKLRKPSSLRQHILIETVEELRRELAKEDSLDVKLLRKQFELLVNFLKEKYDTLFNLDYDDEEDDDNAQLGSSQPNVNFADREHWHAQDPVKPLNPIKLPVDTVIVIHTGTDTCYTYDDCRQAAASIQKFHIDNLHWDDIGYNFLIGGDGTVFEGRGFDHVGAHTKGRNLDSIGVALIGTFSGKNPSKRQLNALQRLLQYGIKNDKLSENYGLYPHSAFTATDSPGIQVTKHLEAWERYRGKKFDDDVKIIDGNVHFVERDIWLAKPFMNGLRKISIPADGVVIHHTETDACMTKSHCEKKILLLQTVHPEIKGWDDIGYNFLVAGDGRIYEGVGWNYTGEKGQRPKNYYAFAVVGTFDEHNPENSQMAALKALIKYAVKNNKIKEDYKLYPYSYFTKTTSPGEKVVDVISHWPQYVSKRGSQHNRGKS